MSSCKVIDKKYIAPSSTVRVNCQCNSAISSSSKDATLIEITEDPVQAAINVLIGAHLQEEDTKAISDQEINDK